MGLLPSLNPEDLVDTVDEVGGQIIAPARDLAEENAQAIANGISNVSAEAREAAANTYDKLADMLAMLGATVQEYAEALDDLTDPQRKKFVDFINNVDVLKGLSAEIRTLKLHFTGIMIKDFLSGEHKRFAIALARKTANFLKAFNDVVQMLNDLIGLFGNGLKSKLRNQNTPALKKALNL